MRDIYSDSVSRRNAILQIGVGKGSPGRTCQEIRKSEDAVSVGAGSFWLQRVIQEEKNRIRWLAGGVCGDVLVLWEGRWGVLKSVCG